MASQEFLGEMFKLSIVQEELQDIQDDIQCPYGINTPTSCEATNLFEEDIKRLFEERTTESNSRLERHHELIKETMKKEIEAGRRRVQKLEELKLAEERQQKLDKTMTVVAKKDKGKVIKVVTSKESDVIEGRKNVTLRRPTPEQRSRWRQLLVESTKQARVTRAHAVEEFQRADAELKQAIREKKVETLKQQNEDKVKIDGAKRNLLSKYREARALQRILEKEQEAQLESQNEREEFFAGKKAAQIKRQLMEAQDKVDEGLKCEEIRQRTEKMERSQKLEIKRNELKALAENKHRQLWKKYRRAEDVLGGSDIEMKNFDNEIPATPPVTDGGESTNVLLRIFTVIWHFFRTLLRPCRTDEN